MERLIKQKRTQGLYYRIESRNILERLLFLSREGKLFDFWNNLEQIQSMKIEKVESKSDWIEMTVVDQITGLNKVENINVHFTFNQVDFFTTATILGSDGLKKSFKLDQYVYQYEPRKEERLLAFPHRKIFIYFDIQNSFSKNNVFYLNKMQTGSTGVFKNFIKVASDEKYITTDGTPMTGFRVLDVSSTGLSFLANPKEVEQFREKQKVSLAKLDWSEETFELKKVIVTSLVDYIDSRTPQVSMFKIGIVYDKNAELEKKLSILLSDENIKPEDLKIFTAYLDKKSSP